MAHLIDQVIDSFKQTLDINLLLYFLLVLLIEMVVSGVIITAFLLLGLAAVFGSISSVGLENIALLFSDPARFMPFMGIIGFLLFIMILVVNYVSALFTGIRLNLFNDFALKKGLDLGRAFAKATPRAMTYFLADLLVTIVIMLVLLAAALPIIGPLASLIKNSSDASAIGAIAAFGILFLLIGLALVIVLVLVSPALALLSPTAFFERRGAIDSIKRAFELMKADYWGNLGFIIVFTAMLIGIGFIVSIFLQVIQIAISISSAALGSAALGLIAVFGIIYILVEIPFIIWSTAFQAACYRNLFFADTGLLRPGKGQARPGRKA